MVEKDIEKRTKVLMTDMDLRRLYGIHKNKINTFIEIYKNFVQYVIDRQIKLDQSKDTMWMANLKSPVTFYIVNGLFGRYLDLNASFETNKVGIQGDELSYDLQTAIQAAQDLIYYSYTRDETKDEMELMALEAIMFGTCFGQILHYEGEERVKYATENGLKDKSIPYAYESLEYISALSAFTSAGAKRIDGAKYVVVRKVMNIDEVPVKYKHLYKFSYNKEKILASSPVETKDWDMVMRQMMFMNTTNYQEGLDVIYSYDGNGGIEAMYNDIISDNSFSIGGDLVEVFEVHSKEDIQIFINQIDCGVYPKQFARSRYPFTTVSFKKGLTRIRGIGAGYLIKPLQGMIDTFLNLKMDSSRLQAAAPMVTDSSETIFEGTDVLSLYPHKLLKVSSLDKMPQKLEMGGNPSIAEGEISYLTNLIQNMLGLTGYSLGQQQKVERAARGIQEYVEAAERGFKDFINNWGAMLGFVAKYWVINAITHMSDKMMEKICGNTELKKVPLEDIVENYKISFDMRTLDSIDDSVAINNISRVVNMLSGMQYPDGAPLLDVEKAAKEIIEKANLDEDFLFTEEESFNFMKKQIDRNAELKEYEQSKMPQQPMQPGQGGMPQMPGIVPNMGEGGGAPINIPEGMPSQPGIQGGQIGPLASNNNPDGENQF